MTPTTIYDPIWTWLPYADRYIHTTVSSINSTHAAFDLAELIRMKANALYGHHFQIFDFWRIRLSSILLSVCMLCVRALCVRSIVMRRRDRMEWFGNSFMLFPLGQTVASSFRCDSAEANLYTARVSRKIDCWWTTTTKETQRTRWKGYE